MSVKLRYTPAHDGSWSGERDWSEVGDGSLRYKLFLGTVNLHIAKCDFSVPWSVPILDFAAGLFFLLNELEGSPEQVFDFTEGEGELRFARSGMRVEISATYANCAASTELDDLRRAVTQFCDDVFTELRQAAPQIEDSVAFMRIESLIFPVSGE